MTTIGPNLQREADCEAVLRSLPQWFGIEEALVMYARDSGTMFTFAEEVDGQLVGFITLLEHFPEAWEVHCIAVHAGHRNSGIGSLLLAHAERWLVERGSRFLQIKTIAASRPDTNYAQTRAFYAAKGYVPLEVFPTLWSPANPVLQLVKALNAA